MMAEDMKFGPLAESVYRHKYAMTSGGGIKETWPETSRRVADSVCGPFDKDLAHECDGLIRARALMPAGRYLYAAGRKYHQCNNCALLGVSDSRKGWAGLVQRTCHMLMTGMGVGVVYSDVREKNATVGGLGGLATGPCALMQIINEQGRHIQQGGSRRSALWAGLHWNHTDVFDFLALKNWPEWMRKAKQEDFNAAATMDGTNISVILDDAFFHAWHNVKHRMHSHARSVYAKTVRQMLKTGEPGFSIDVGKNAGEHLRNACFPAGTRVLTSTGYRPIECLVGEEVDVWNGDSWSTVRPRATGHNRPLVKVTLSDGVVLTCTEDHKWLVNTGDFRSPREERVEAKDLAVGQRLMKYRMPVVRSGEPMENAYPHGFYCGDGHDAGGKALAFLYGEKMAPASAVGGKGTGRVLKQNRTFVTLPTGMPKKFFVPLHADLHSRLQWLSGLLDADGTVLQNKNSVCLQLGSVNKTFLDDVRLLLTTLGVQAKVTMAHGEREGLLPDGLGGERLYPQQAFYRLLINASDTYSLVTLGLATRRLSVPLKRPQRDARRFVEVVSVKGAGVAPEVYCFNEPSAHRGTFEGVVTGQCTEVTSRDDDDVCNLASLNMARFDSLEKFRHAVRAGVGLLFCGTMYSDLPTKALIRVREKNRRLGLGLMGMHEWLVKRGRKYGPDDELRRWLEVYRDESDHAAKEFADRFSKSRPVARRAIAPTGTIAILAETTSGIEPIFAVAFKRRFLKGDTWHAQYVVDAAAERLIQGGASPDKIEDAYTLASDPVRRLGFQAFVQEYVDMGISSTLNTHAWGSQGNNPDTVEAFASTLFDHLPHLRGVTAYPDGARGGQPLVPMSYHEVVHMKGVEFTENGNEQSCVSGVCGA